MEFHVECECGAQIPVTEGQSGTLVTCTCGRENAVPGLGELRRLAGLPTYQASTADVIGRMLAAGELPPGEACAKCERPTDEVLGTMAECELASMGIRGGKQSAAVMLFGWIGALLVPDTQKTTHEGKSLAVRVPIRLCRNCRRATRTTTSVLVCRVAKWPLAAAGLMLLVLGDYWSILFFAVALAVWLIERALANREQRALKKLLRQVPVYDQLLEEYPDATVVVFE